MPEIEKETMAEQNCVNCLNSAYNADETIVEKLTHLARYKWLIAKVTGIAMCIGLILCFTLPLRYTAITRIMPPKQTQSAAALLASQMGVGSLSDAAGGGLGLKDPNAIYVGLLKSRPVADAIIEHFGLMKVYGSKDMTSARKRLESNTQIVSEKSTLISITVTDGDKKRAADIANAYTEQLRALTKTVSLSEASQRRLFYEDQLKDAKENLVAAEGSLQQIEQSKGLVHLDTQATAIIGSMANARAQVAAKQVELQTLRSYSTERNPDVQLAEHELSSLQGQVAQLEQHNSSSGFSDLGLKNIPQAGLDYIRAQREVQYQQAFYDMLLKQFEAAKLDEAKEASVIQVVEPAIVPERKSAPKRAMIMALATLLGLFSGCLLVRFMLWMETEQADPTRAEALQNLICAVTGRKASE